MRKTAQKCTSTPPHPQVPTGTFTHLIFCSCTGFNVAGIPIYPADTPNALQRGLACVPAAAPWLGDSTTGSVVKPRANTTSLPATVGPVAASQTLQALQNETLPNGSTTELNSHSTPPFAMTPGQGQGQKSTALNQPLQQVSTLGRQAVLAGAKIETVAASASTYNSDDSFDSDDDNAPFPMVRPTIRRNK